MFRVVAKTVDGVSTVILPEYYTKNFVIGRNNLNLKIGSNVVGREHACFKFDSKSGKLLLKANSVNPCFVKKNSSEIVKLSKNDESIDIRSGDQVSIVGQSLWISFQILKAAENSETNEKYLIGNKRDRKEEELNIGPPEKKLKISQFPTYEHPGLRYGVERTKYWKNALVEILQEENSDWNKRRIYHRDHLTLTIYDSYPKSRIHLLMIVRSNIDNVLRLKKDHIPLLEHMKLLSYKMADELSSYNSDNNDIIIGFHSVPSLSRLHLHIISTDFSTELMKNKKHYNSFATSFFLPIEKVIEELKNNGKLGFKKNEKEDILKFSLRCLKCKRGMKTVPNLKQHLLNCKIKK